MKAVKVIWQYVCIIFFAAATAVNFSVFIFPNSFAPTGVDGVFTMLQDITGITLGYISLLGNLPLLIAAFIFLKKEVAIKSTVYVAAFCIVNIILSNIDISAFTYHTDTSTSIVLAPIAAGAIKGVIYVGTLKTGSTSGGIDIIAALVKSRKPHLNFMNVIFILNMLIACSSYFVYDFKYEPVICAIIYSFILSSVSNHIRANEHQMIKFEIITDDIEELCNQIFKELHRTATIMDAQGAYSGENKKMLVCVIEKNKAYMLENLIKKRENTFFFESIVSDLYE